MLGYSGILAIVAASLCNNLIRPVSGLTLPIAGSQNVSQSLDQHLLDDIPPEFDYDIHAEGLSLEERKFLLTTSDVLVAMACHKTIDEKVSFVGGLPSYVFKNALSPGVELELTTVDRQLEVRHVMWGVWVALCKNGFSGDPRNYMTTQMNLYWKEQSRARIMVGKIEIRRSAISSPQGNSTKAAKIDGPSTLSPVDTGTFSASDSTQDLLSMSRQNLDSLPNDIVTSPSDDIEHIEMKRLGNVRMNPTQMSLPIFKVLIKLAQMDKLAAFNTEVTASVLGTQSSFVLGPQPGMDPQKLRVINMIFLLNTLRNVILFQLQDGWQCTIKFIEGGVPVANAQIQTIGQQT